MLNQASFPYASINPCWQASDQPISTTRSSIHWIATLKRETILVNAVDSRFSQNSGVFDSGFSAKIHGEMGIFQGGFAFAKQREIALLPGSPRSKGSRRSIEMGKMQVTNKFHHSWDPNCSFKSLRNANFHVKLPPPFLYINRKAYHK